MTTKPENQKGGADNRGTVKATPNSTPRLSVADQGCGGSGGCNRQGLRILRHLIFSATLLFAIVTQAQLLTLDDGSVDTFGGTPSGDLLALNHFNTGSTPVLIDQILVLWNPISRSVSPTVALYSDPNGDGNPSDMTPLLIQPISIPPGVVVLNNTSVQGYSIPPTLVSGSFFVGAYLSDREASFNPVIGVDLAHRGPNQSWIIENASVGLLSLQNPMGTSTLRTPLDTYIAGNHMIEAHFTPVPEPSSGWLVALAVLYSFASRVQTKTGLSEAHRQDSAVGRFW